MRALLNGLCCLTMAASGWLGVMFVVLQRPGYEWGLAMSAGFILQSLLTMAVAGGTLVGGGWLVLALAGAAGIIWAGAAAVARNLNGPHFEAYAVITGVQLVLQGLLTAAQLITTHLSSSTKVHQFGN